VTKDKIQELKAEREAVAAEFRKVQAEVNRQVQEKLDAAGLSGLLASAQATIEKERQRLQSKADYLTGQIQALESVFGADEAEVATDTDTDTDVTPVDDAPVAEA
jgi:predicted nuclease with TOPRIM domain